MYRLLVILMVGSAFQHTGLSLKDLADCKLVGCVQKLEVASSKILRIDWKAISVFPDIKRDFLKN